jgi:hypothetical protein
MKKTVLSSIFVLVLVALLLPAAFAGKVKSQVGKEAEFTRYKTYKWLPPKVLTKMGIVENHPANPMLKEVFASLLASKGLKEVPEGADLEIQVAALNESVPQLEAVVMFGGYYLMYDTAIATMGRYNKEGTLLINMIDIQKKKSAWAAVVTESIPTKPMDEKQLREKVEKAAKKIFEKYPAAK